MAAEPPRTPRKHESVAGKNYDMRRQDAVSHSLVTWHSRAKKPISLALLTLPPHPNFKLSRAKARPGVGLLARMESSLMSRPTEASKGQGAQGHAG